MTQGQPPDALVRARGLVKRYGERASVAGIDFDVVRGEALGVLGPNGAGKSTTMRMIGCVCDPTDGRLEIFGLDPLREGPQIRGRLGVCPQADALDPELSVHDNLVSYARFFGLSRATARQRAARLLEFARLSERAGSRVETLSGGMRRRVTIARALVNDPELVLLDEPTTGLDPQARHVVWERLFQLKRQGVTLLLTTHYMDEAEQLCDRLLVMDGGRIVAEGSPRGLIEEHVTRDVVELRFGDPDPDDLTGKLDGIGRVEVLPDRLMLYVHDGDAAGREVQRRGLEPETVLIRRCTLEDVFLRLTGRQLID